MKKYIRYKGVPVNSIGIPIFDPLKNKEVKKYKNNKRNYHNSFSATFSKNSPKNLIVMYDIPHEQKNCQKY